MKKRTSAPAAPGRRLYQGTLLALTILAVLNLLLSASLVGLIGSAVLLVMVWDIHRGQFSLSKVLAVFLFLYAGVNLAVLCLVSLAGAEASLSARIWLGVYSALLAVLGGLLLSRGVQTYLKTAKPPEKKDRKIHFFHGGWRDL